MNILLPTADIPAVGPIPPRVPESICFTPDKNRTWAQSFGLPPMAGHDKGRDVAEHIIRACFDAGVRDVIVWIMSESNRYKRGTSQTNHIKELLKAGMRSREDRDDDVGFYLCGHWNDFRDAELDDLAKRAHARNRKDQRQRLTVLCNYRGITDLMQAASRVAEKFGPEACENLDLVRAHMWVSHLPEHIEMMVRTGVNPSDKHNSDSLLPLHGEHAYIYDTPVWWPQFTVAHLYESFRAFGECMRAKGA